MRLAFGTLSVLPTPMPRKVDRSVGGRAMALAPVVGLILGAGSACVVAAVAVLRPDAPVLAAVLGVMVLVGLSGALHLDGLADTADGLGSRRDRETMLRIMKQGDVGPFGVAAIVGVLLTDVAALAACVQAGIGWQSLVIAGTASRLTLVWSCRTGVPAARADGLGAAVAGTVRPRAVALATVATAVVAVALLVLSGPESRAVGVWAGAAVVAAVLPVAVCLALLGRTRRALGGVTGDVLGAGVELGVPVALLSLALLA